MSRIPTTDLYFLNSCGHRVSNWRRAGPVRKIGQNSFAVADTRLLIRRDTDAIMTDFLNENCKLIYLVDDDIEGAALSPALPEDYRRRLMEFHAKFHRALTRRANILVVTSAALLEQFSWHRDVRLLHPIWDLPMADNAHFANIGENGLIKAVHLGSGSHKDGVTFLYPVLSELLHRHQRLHFTYIHSKPLLGQLDDHPRVARIKPQSWKSHKKWIARQRFHLGLYPLPNTPFHRARSRNKLLEYGVTGAVGVYPDHWQPAQEMLGHAILCGPEQYQWADAISDVLQHPQRLQALSHGSQQVLERLNTPLDQKRFWSDVLKVDFE